MDNDFAETSHWTKEGWVKKFREIWRSPEDMKERLHQGLQLYFSSPHLTLTKSSPLAPDSFPILSASPSSLPSSSSLASKVSTDESVSRLLYLWTEIRNDQPLALEVAKAFEAWLKQSSAPSVDVNDDVNDDVDDDVNDDVDSSTHDIALAIDDDSRAKALHLATLSLGSNGFQIPALYEALFRFTQHKDELKLEIDRRLNLVSDYRLS